jgi:predicted transcriptional regulator
MIDFACKKFNLDEIIKCGLGLSRSDYFILSFLVKQKKELSSNEVSTNTGFDLSTSQRSLKKLREQNLISRRQVNLSSGGYIYYYKGQRKEEIKKKILEIVSSWSKKVEEELENW